MPRPKKVAAVEGIRARLRESEAALLTDYRGLTVKAITELRRRLRGVGSEYHVVKNTLMKKALGDADAAGLAPYLEGPTAVAFARNPVEVAKILAGFIKEFKLPVLKGGMLGGRVYPGAQMESLATMPPREALLANLIGSAQSPVAGLVTTAQGVLRNLLGTVEAIAAKRAA